MVGAMKLIDSVTFITWPVSEAYLSKFGNLK